jgi:hypothetical protein
MKKLVFIIIALLPVFLVFTIGLASRIYSQKTFIYVERVAFVDESENPYGTEDMIRLSPGEAYVLKYKIYPTVATNTKVSFFSENEDLCKIDQQGNLTIEEDNYGSTYVMVRTEDGKKTAKILIYVIGLKVERINLVTAPSLDLFIGEKKQMGVEIIPYTATNKNIIWSSSNESVCRVDANGLISTLSSGQAVITALTKDGGLAVSCEVTVRNNEIITFTDESSKIANTEIFDLSTLIVNCNADYQSLVTYQITSGGAYASIEGSVLTFYCFNQIVEVEIKLEAEGKTFSKKIILMSMNNE